MKKDFRQKNKNGYTIIETMIAISLFIIIVMAGMGALLNANLLHNKSKDMRSIMDNLSFVVEDMSRNLRIGFNYYCIPPSGEILDYTGITRSCPDPASAGGGISFKSGYDGSQWVYYGNDNKIFRKIGNNEPIQLTPNEIEIEDVSFIVTGAEPPSSGDNQQPFVTIKLSGEITMPGKNVKSPFSLQTAVSQRLIDIGI